MSRKQFFKEVQDHVEWRQQNNLPIHSSVYDVDKYIRDKWISESRHRELIAYILNEWDNGDFNTDTDFIKGYEHQLLKQHLPGPFILLWKGILKIRVESWWWHYKKLVSGNEIYRNSASEKHSFLISGMKQYIDGLLELKEFVELEKIMKVKEMAENFKRPKIE